MENEIFTIVLDENNDEKCYRVVTGTHLMSTKKFESEEEAKKYIATKPWELYWNLIGVYLVTKEEYEKKTKEDETKGTIDSDS